MKTMSKEYTILFNEITDVSEELAKLTGELSGIVRRLMYAQRRTEELFIEQEELEENLIANQIED